ncbi:oxidoreductase [Ameyamaea chiangmaiensis NBRC 103196]|uniref:Oxidoreductase n=1 Tax=Ameyamaea chiangmaiensis TaxID=442969 RepID=A0A850PJR1_9PROT|nr:oxidoreductase [Ameyamaea chiangmaiensis]MBS4075524.1 oxidoreductase [Ameyamaea chiangmaiensis]NVN41521.1 oxidoreductase [Ameyamaea chiangmaiensis]GBQ69436.1 oxidoreductase [Ameyamaea chiangmaiensis NBRC 103196]
MNAQVPIRVGLIGYGFAGRTFHAPLIGAEPGLTLTTVASSNPAKVHQDLPDARVLPDPMRAATADDLDLIVIASPNDSHAPLARAALESGKHVVVDKPFTLNIPEARDLIALATKNDRLLSVFHNRRWDSDFLNIRTAIDDGEIGAVTHVESHIDRFRPEVRQRWRELDGPGSGLWFDVGPHLIDQALQLFGLPDRVVASLARQRSGALANDWAHVVLEYGQRRVVLHASMLVAGGTARFVVHGERGSLVKASPDQQEAQLVAGMRPGAPSWGADPDPVLVYDETGRARSRPPVPGDQRLYYKGIAAALRGEAPNPVTPLQALAVMAVLEAASHAAETGQAVPPDLSEQERAAWG